MSEESEQVLSILTKSRYWSGMGMRAGEGGSPGWEARAASLVHVYMLSQGSVEEDPHLLPHPRL